MNKSKRKLLITMLVMMFVLLSAVAVVAIAFSLTQQTITTTLNITYTVEDIIGSVKAEYTIGSSTTSLTAYKNGTAQGSELIFNGNETSSDSFSLEFPQELTLTKSNPEVIIKYTYANDGPVHYIASMDLNTTALENMNVSYSTDGTEYGVNRYAVVVPEHSSNKSYWIKISIANTALNASLSGEFSWFLDDCDESEIGEAYKSLTSLTFESNSSGTYSVSVSSAGAYTGRLVFPSEVNGTPVTKITSSNINLTNEQKSKITSVFIPASVTEIEAAAFARFGEMETITFAENSKLTTVGENMFMFCSSLTEITIPQSVTKLGYGLFGGCTSLTKVEVESGNTTYHSAGNCIIETATKTLVQLCNASIIPDDGSVTKINAGAFYCLTFDSLIIPSSVTSMKQSCATINNLILQNPNSWSITKQTGSTTFEKIAISIDLSDPAIAAEYFTRDQNYCLYEWTRED